MRLVWAARTSGYRGKIDNSPTRLHMSYRKLRGKENRLKIQCQDGIPFLLGYFQERGDHDTARVINQYTDGPPLRSAIDDPLNFIQLCEISLDCQRLRPQMFKLLLDLLQG